MLEYWQNVERISKERNLKVADFANLTGLSISYLTAVKKRKYKRPSQNTLFKICSAFNIPPTDVYEQADEKYLLKGEQKYVQAFWRQFIEPLMTEKKITVTKLAQESDTNRVYLSAIKNGYIAQPAPDVVIKLANYFQADYVKWFKWLENNLGAIYVKNGDVYDYEKFKNK